MKILSSMSTLPKLDSDTFLAMPTEELGGLPEVVRWCITQSLMLSVEVDTRYIRRHVPPELTPVEVRPGVSLYTILFNEMLDGNAESELDIVPFYEVLSVVPVHPDLSVDMPVPRFTFYALKIISNSLAFVNNERKRLLLDVRHRPTLRLERASDFDVRLSDESGDVYRIKPTLEALPPIDRFEWRDYWIQFYSGRDAALHRGICSWSGFSHEIQKVGDYGRLHTDHEFFDATPDLGAHVGDVYMQYFSPISTLCFERFWGMERIR